VVKKLTGVGKQGSVMFIDNSLTQKEGLDVTAIVPPIENLEQIKALVQSNKLVDKRSAKEQLAPVALALEQAIQNDPNILGKDILGQDYEGIVINSRLGPIKVTSPEQKKVIADKQAAKAAARTEQPRTGNKTAVVAIGSFVGHKGHQQLFGYTINKAKEVGGDPYLFMGSAVGADDPIPVADKIKTWKQLYPEYAGNIGAVTQEGGSLMQKIKHELINPLPGKPPRYDNVIIMVGEDQAKMPIAQALMKAVNKFPGYEHVKVQLEVTPRGTGMSFTKLRNVLKTGDEQQAFDMWNDAFNGGQDGAKPLPAAWIKHLMDVSRTGMGVQQKPAVQQPAAPAIGEMRLFNALMKSSLNELSSEKLGQYKKAAGAQASAADKAGDTKKADKRFSGIVKATKKQFANDEKGVAEGHGAMDPATMDKISHSVKAWNNADRNVEQLITQGHTIKFYPDKIEIFKGGDLLYSKDGNFSNVSNGMVVRAKNLVSNLIYKSKQGVAEGAPIVVAQAPIHIRNPKKDPQPYRNQGDIVPPTKSPSTEKRGVKGRPGQRPMPKYDETMLPTSAFAGSDKNKLAPQGQLKGTAPKKYPKNKLVGENKCVPIGEAYEVEMALAILKLFEDKK
jgi:hypothetical protein